MLPARRSWQTVLCSEEGGGQPPPLVCSSCRCSQAAHLHNLIVHGKVCVGAMTSLSSRREMPEGGRAREGRRARGGPASSGLPRRGSLGAEALHNPVSLHAVKKEEVVVRWVPLRQGLGGKQEEGSAHVRSKGQSGGQSPQASSSPSGWAEVSQ